MKAPEIWVKITEITTDYYLYRWGDWLKVIDVRIDGDKTIITALDTNPQDGVGMPIEASWRYNTVSTITKTPMSYVQLKHHTI